MTDERSRPGPSTRAIRAALLWVSAGLEDEADLLDDFGRALQAAREA